MSRWVSKLVEVAPGRFERLVEKVPLSPAEQSALEAEWLANEEAVLRTRRRREVIAEAVRRISEQLPGYDSVEAIERLSTLAGVGVIIDSADPAWVEAKRLFQKHKQMRAQLLGASLQQLRGFDATDEALWAP